MRNLLLLLSVIVAILLSACEKDDPKDQINGTPNPVTPTNFFFSGTYYEEYGDTIGIANAEIVLETEDDFGVPVIVGLDTTDENGCFRIDYEKLNRNEVTLFVRWIDPNSITNPKNGFRYQCLPGDTNVESMLCLDGTHSVSAFIDFNWDPSNVQLDTLFLTGFGFSQFPEITIIRDNVEYKVKYAVVNTSGSFRFNFTLIFNQNNCHQQVEQGRWFTSRQLYFQHRDSFKFINGKSGRIKYEGKLPPKSYSETITLLP